MAEAGEADPVDRVGKVVHYAVRYPYRTGAEIELLSISPNAEEVFGYPLAVWEKPQDQWLQMLYPGDYARAVSSSWATTRFGTPYSIQYRVARADAEIVWVLDEATVERDGDDHEVWRGRYTVIDAPPPTGWTPEILGPHIVSILGRDGARDLLSALEGPAPDRTAQIDALVRRGGTGWLAPLLTEMEMDEQTRVGIIEGLRRALESATGG